MNIITKLPKQWIEENEFHKYYYFINDNNKIYYHTYNKELNRFVIKNERSNWSIKDCLYYINNPTNQNNPITDFWYKKIRPIIIKALKEEEFNNLIKEL